jgi:hypothetical protein
MTLSADAAPDAVAAAVQELVYIERDTGWNRVKRVAEVLQRYALLPERSSAVGIRRIASHPACPLSKSQLCDLLAAHAVYRAEPLLRGSCLTPSHAAAVAQLPVTRRRSLLQAAIDERLSVRSLRDRAREARSVVAHGRGRPKASNAARALTRMENAALALDEALSFLVLSPRLSGLERRFEHVLEELRLALRRTAACVRPSLTPPPSPQLDSLGVRSCGHAGHDGLVPVVQLGVQPTRPERL